MEQLINQGNAGFFERHGNGATTNIQGANSGDGTDNVLGTEGLIDVIQAEGIIEIIMKASTEVAGTRTQRHAHDGIFIDERTHERL